MTRILVAADPSDEDLSVTLPGGGEPGLRLRDTSATESERKYADDLRGTAHAADMAAGRS